MNGMITVAKNSNNTAFIKHSYSIGVRDFRINMDYEKQAYEAFETIHSLNLPDVRIFADFQGIKMRIRLADGKNDIQYHVGETLFIHTNSDNYPNISNFDLISEYVKPGHMVSIADDKITAKVVHLNSSGIEIQFTKVDYVLRQNAGCSIIGEDIPTPHMTRKICNSIANTPIVQFKRVEWIILSFVESSEDIVDFVVEMHKLGIKVMAKIETPNGVNNIHSIARIVDGFMIGRGDLKSTTKGRFELTYKKAIEDISQYSQLYNGVGTFFLANYCQTLSLQTDEITDIEYVQRHGFDYIMLSKEVVNSSYPYETINKLQELCKK